MTDEQQRAWARAFQVSGDRAAFAALAGPHLDALYTVAIRMLGNAAEADDIAQDALVRALEQHHRYDAQRPFRPWLLTIAANLCRDRARGGWWRGLATRWLSPTPTATTDPVEAAEQDALVRRALAALPTRYREALSLFHLDEMSYAEMSEITGVSVSALKQRVHRGNTMLEAEVLRLCPGGALVRTVGQGSR